MTSNIRLLSIISILGNAVSLHGMTEPSEYSNCLWNVASVFYSTVRDVMRFNELSKDSPESRITIHALSGLYYC